MNLKLIVIFLLMLCLGSFALAETNTVNKDSTAVDSIAPPAPVTMFKAFDIEKSITELRKTKVGLPNGGSIIIQEAESLCAIDVNTGRFTGSRSQEETVTLTNVEAAREVARQLRLRNIGGIIVIDFIDMKRASNRHRIVNTLERAVRKIGRAHV